MLRTYSLLLVLSLFVARAASAKEPLWYEGPRGGEKGSLEWSLRLHALDAISKNRGYDLRLEGAELEADPMRPSLRSFRVIYQPLGGERQRVRMTMREARTGHLLVDAEILARNPAQLLREYRAILANVFLGRPLPWAKKVPAPPSDADSSEASMELEEVVTETDIEAVEASGEELASDPPESSSATTPAVETTPSDEAVEPVATPAEARGQSPPTLVIRRAYGQDAAPKVAKAVAPAPEESPPPPPAPAKVELARPEEMLIELDPAPARIFDPRAPQILDDAASSYRMFKFMASAGFSLLDSRIHRVISTRNSYAALNLRLNLFSDDVSRYDHWAWQVTGDLYKPFDVSGFSMPLHYKFAAALQKKRLAGPFFAGLVVGWERLNYLMLPDRDAGLTNVAFRQVRAPDRRGRAPVESVGAPATRLFDGTL